MVSFGRVVRGTSGMAYKPILGPDGRTITAILHPDGYAIPIDPGNADYQTYLTWLAAGHTADQADPRPLTYSLNRPINARVRTTDANATELYRSTLSSMTGYTALLRAIGVDSGNGACRVVLASVLVK